MKFMRLFLLAFIISLVTGCSLDDYDQAVADDGEAISKPLLADEELEFVELLIDGSCKDGEVFNEEDESCSVVIDCNGEDYALWGDNLALELEENYGSLTEENSHIPDFDVQMYLSNTMSIQTGKRLKQMQMSHKKQSINMHHFGIAMPDLSQNMLAQI